MVRTEGHNVEHSTLTQGVVRIDSFVRWGVELGKGLPQGIEKDNCALGR
ncbi:MAG: hypothetical protein ACYDEV_06625 [Acidiferrobacter sp.]